MGQFDGRRLSAPRLGILVLVVAAVVFAALRGWQWFEEAQASARADWWFAGYVDVTATPTLAFEEPDSASTRAIVLSFVVANPHNVCEPSWGGAYSLDEAADQLDLDRRIARRRQQGGTAIISFGGQANTELAVSCTDQAKLEAAYSSVLNRYDAAAIDLDVEGAQLDDTAANRRRAKVLADLQEGRDLKVWLTLPVAPQGLTSPAREVVDATLEAGVQLAGVNVMTMDYGGSKPSTESMGQAAVDALNATHDQLISLYRKHGLDLGSTGAWQHLGATAMIGQNDVAGEIFTLADAAELHDFAVGHHLGRVSLWSLNRDRACGSNYPDTRIVSDACSGVDQADRAFAETMGADSDHAPGETTPEPTPVAQPTVTPSDDPAVSPYTIWSPEQVYLADTRVVWHRNVYVAKWWTSGDLPDDPLLDQDASPWTLVGPVLPGETPLPAPTLPAHTYPAWLPGTVYHTGDRVMLEGIPFVAQWWTQGENPTGPSTLSDPSPWRQLTEREFQIALQGH